MSIDQSHPTLEVDGAVDPLGRQAVDKLLSEGICRSARYFATTASTNSCALADLQQAILKDTNLPRLYLADAQTAGRGRHGRSWISSDDTLTFSLLLSHDIQNHERRRLLPLAIGVGVARAIEFQFAPLGSRLKWPNDVYLDGGKVAGILIETTQGVADRVVIGVGININHAPELAESPGAATTRSIAQCAGRTLDRYRLLEPFVAEMTDTIRNATAAEILQEFRERCLLAGRQVSFNLCGRPLEGECLGVSDEGELMVQVGDTMHRCTSGEAHLIRTR